MTREIRTVTVSVAGRDRDGFWKRGDGVYVPGHDLHHGDIVTIDGTQRRIVKLRRLVSNGEAVTLIVRGVPVHEL